MIDILIDLLTPIFVSMGASAADVGNYIRNLSTYIYVILGALVLVIALIVAVRFFVKKQHRILIRGSAVVCWVLVVLIVVNMICYGPMYPTISGVLNASRAEISDDVVGNSMAVIQETGEEGMVLVKNDGLLPLASDTVNLNVFGWASVCPVYSGTGSAASGDNLAPAISILQSLSDAGYSMNSDLIQMYLAYASERPSITMQTQDWTLPEPTMDAYTPQIMDAATAFSDTAVIVIARSGGENADLPTDMKAVIDGTYDLADTDAVAERYRSNYGYTNGLYTNNGDYDDFDEGDHYLQLSNTEEALVDLVCANFENVIVLINTNNTMELGWVDEYDNIGAVILAPATGNCAMTALGGILNGSINPSGRTVDTYVKDLTQAPSWNHSGNSGNHFYTGAEDIIMMVGRNDNTFQGVVSFVDYVEGIYMGYKFYETAAEEGLINYEDYVQYPFGYGLSYTTFTQEITDFSQNDTTVTVEVTVTNTGDVAGKDVVELYYTPPYTNGGIEKASVNLIDFGKTQLLEPGASEVITLTVALEDMASYDSACIKTANGGYILEAGEYVMSIRSDSHTVLDSETFTLSADIDYSTDGRASDGLVAENRFGYVESDHEILSRRDGFANYDAATAPPSAEEYEMNSEDMRAIQNITLARYDPTDYDDPNDVMPTMGADNGLVLADLTGKAYDDPDWDRLLDQMSLEDMITLVNTGGWQTAPIESVGKVATSDCDGPSGLSNYVTGASGTQFPSEILMAQTWSKEMADKLGDALGQEFASANNFGWYGPGLNLHRFAFSGRNYEYYSEDPVLSGIFASYEINSAAKYGVYSYMKHFAANDQETNRCAFLMTYMPEQVLRENVLRPFEMVVKNFDYENNVLGVMSSYNWLGTVPVCSNYDLLTTVLREEWGFVGTVISDYNGGYGYMISDASMRAGNDLMLGYGMAESNIFTDTDAATCVLAIRQACKNILYTVGNSGYYFDAAAATEQDGMDNMTKLFVTVNAVVIVLALAVEALVVILWRKKVKAAQTARTDEKSSDR